MNYYIKGDKERAEEIKAAFEKKGVGLPIRRSCADDGLIYFLLDGEVFSITIKAIELFEKNPDYKELELPVEPKFKVGDWIVQNDNGTVSQITKVINDTDEYGEYRAYEHTNGYFHTFFEKEFHLWTIQDAKDGDVLMTTKVRICPFIYRKNVYNNNLAYYYVGIDGNGDFCEGCIKRTLTHFGPVADVLPATKEQRDLLFAKMKEAGYEWDANKKELHKIQPHYDIANFQAGMPVLVRDSDEHKWLYTLFGIYNKDNALYPFVVVNMRGYEQCIPFNDDTKHLLGTTDMCPQKYINW